MTDVRADEILVISLLAFFSSFRGAKRRSRRKEKLKQAALKKKAKANLRENSDVDFQAFVGRLRKAVATRDMETLKSMMTDDFGYKLEPPMSGSGRFPVLGAGKSLAGAGRHLVREIREERRRSWSRRRSSPTLTELRRLSRRDYSGRGSWKFAYFVNG